jgi:ketosteroid isomerase-like protein
MRILATFAALIALSSCARETPGPQAATEAIKAQIAKYLAALDAADSAMAGEVWLNSPEISLIWPLGYEHGWDQIKKIYAFFGQNYSDRKLTAHDIVVHVNGDTAWAEYNWHFDAKQNRDGAAISTDGRETQIYRRVEPNRWALVHEHYSGLPPAPDPLN